MIEDVPPGPQPTQAEALGVAYDDGGRGVMLRFSTPQGASYYFLGEAEARGFGERIVKMASPPSGLVTPSEQRIITP